MEENRGHERGSYIWGLSIHNTRIERMWYDVTQKFGGKWARFFTELEVHYGLDVARPEHIWLLHHLFLPKINEDTLHWMELWNNHPISLTRQPFRTPEALWNASIVRSGARGLRYTPPEAPAEDHANGDPAMYGIDWDAQADNQTMRHYYQYHPHTASEDDNPFDPAGTNQRYNEVNVEPPDCPLHPNQVAGLDEFVASRVDTSSSSMEVRRQVWVVALQAAHVLWSASQNEADV
ncbi:hypothetical protein BD626DRAFT_414071 [Schizophyllum amplum]|uniref:Integrase core domain-containing protein n=1 Tax=Schizophyllum amplum TaxID=97359 RepID=A0A550BUZ7_9AGAR|nr:hypothetical protein BD626DRAFT_414071 [Auriculariopsis ampla]